MKIVRCKNKRIDNSGEQKTCNRFLICLPQDVLDHLKEGQKIITRCPSCKAMKFNVIKYEGRKLVYESIKNPYIADLKSAEFDDELISEEVGGEAFNG